MRPNNHPKAAGHPKLQEVEFQFNNGKVLKILSTAKKEVIHAGDWPPENHPAWTGSDTGSRLRHATKFAKFQNKFGNLFEEGSESKEDDENSK